MHLAVDGRNQLARHIVTINSIGHDDVSPPMPGTGGRGIVDALVAAGLVAEDDIRLLARQPDPHMHTVLESPRTNQHPRLGQHGRPHVELDGRDVWAIGFGKVVDLLGITYLHLIAFPDRIWISVAAGVFVWSAGEVTLRISCTSAICNPTPELFVVRSQPTISLSP
jgi:hypothetical protein